MAPNRDGLMACRVDPDINTRHLIEYHKKQQQRRSSTGYVKASRPIMTPMTPRGNQDGGQGESQYSFAAAQGGTMNYADDNNAQSAWPQKEDRKAKAIIGKHVCQEFKQAVQQASSASEAWYALEDMCLQQSASFISKKTQKLKDATIKTEGSVLKYLAKIKDIQAEILKYGGTCSESDLMQAIINQLMVVDGYTDFARNLKLIKPSDMSFAGLRQILIEDEIDVSKLNKSQAMVAHSGQSVKSKLKCSNCNKTGHEHANCWAKGGGTEGQGPRNRKADKSKKKKSNGNKKSDKAIKLETKVMKDLNNAKGEAQDISTLYSCICIAQVEFPYR
ncbi:hypothetical protein MP228_011921 [Amoeboaphelidium protococcarum]|nr:hypothetical protein MP228_011921 [Amoeboaphelidium protococcarum]